MGIVTILRGLLTSGSVAMKDRREEREAGQATVSRRDVNRLAGGALATLAFAAGRVVPGDRGRSASAQTGIEATPPSVPAAEGLGAYGPTIASKAAELGYDVERIFRFVTEQVRYEPYAGALRGIDATLWGLAGNSVDQSLLLGALLTESQVTWRVAAAPIADDAANALLDAANGGIARVDESWQRAVEVSLVPTPTPGVATPVTEDDSEEADASLVADVVARATYAATTGEQRFALLAGQIAKALEDASIVIQPAGMTVLPDLERMRHCWVQIADGPRWIDHDPTLSGKDGVAQPEAVETFETMPDDLVHMVAVRISAETLSGTSLYATDVASVQLTAVQAARTPIEIGIAPPQSMAAAGFAISEAVAGTSGLVPYLAMRDGILQAATSPIPFSTGGGALDVLGAATPDAASCGCQDGDLISLSYTVDITSPGSEPVSIQRYLLDRLPPAARMDAASGIVDPSQIQPLNLVDLDDGVTMPVELTSATFLTVTTGDLPSIYRFLAPGSEPAMTGIASVGGSEAGLAAGFARGVLLPADGWAMVAVPQVVAFTTGTVDGKAEGELAMSGDLLRQQRTLLAATNDIAIDGLHPLIAVGILNQVAEGIAIAPEFILGAADAPLTGSVSVGEVFAVAEEQNVGISALGGDGTRSIPQDFPEAIRSQIRQALDAGRVVVVPEQLVSIDGTPVIGWWEIDPATGNTSDVFANGKGYAESRGPGAVGLRAQDAVEEAEILTEVNTWRPWYQRLGRCVGMAAMVAGSAIDPTTFNPGSGSTEGAIKAGIKILTRNPKILNDLKNLANC